LPLPWFRRNKSTDEQAAVEAAAPAPTSQSPVVPEAAPSEGGGDPTKPRRRRGNRGGRGRKRPAASEASTPKAEATAQQPSPRTRAKADQKPRDGEKAKSRRAAPQRRRAPARKPLPAAKRELLVSVDVGEQRVAVLEDDRVAEVYLERPERRSIAGNIYKGVVDNVLPGMEAAFVEIGLEKNGFLYVDEIVTPELEGKRHGKRIQDLLSRGQELLVQAVKDPMKTKGARLTTEISLPGRFVVFVPQDEGIGVSRRLDDDERARLKDILKKLDLPNGGVIVRTAAEGASAEDIERDLLFLQKLWKEIQARAKKSAAPSLVYQEAELPLRVVRDLFTGEFERALVDDDRTLKRISGYLKKTSPHMAERVERHRDKQPLFEQYGVDAEIRSTLSRRVELPSGGYLVFDYAEAFTVIDVNTGRFVGSRSKSSGARLEDTITKNNLEAVKEVVRQLRLRDIGGIIVIDFIDMANPKNRAAVEEALQQELERDRTKTYVVEISPLGLVEMTRQNVTDGPREILTRKCPTCAGEGVVVSEATAVVDAERRLRALVTAKPRTKAFKVELNAHVAELLIGPGAARLEEIEAFTKRRFFVQGKAGVPHDHFAVLDEGTVEKLAVTGAPVAEGQSVELKLVEVGRHDAAAGAGKLDGWSVSVGGAAKLVGKKVNVRITRVLDGTAYATLVDGQPAAAPAPITAEAQAEKPTRASRAKKVEPDAADEVVEDEVIEVEAEAVEEVEAEAVEDEPGEQQPVVETEAPPKRKTRRGSRGGRGRKKPTAKPVAAEVVAEEPAAEPEPESEPVDEKPAEQPVDGQPPKKKTRRGSRGGRGRKKKPAGATTASTNGQGEPEVEISRPTIHVPEEGLGEAEERAGARLQPGSGSLSENGDQPAVGIAPPQGRGDAAADDAGEARAAVDDGDEARAVAVPRKKTRRGSRGGRRRRKPGAATPSETAVEPGSKELEA
jgi:ribonuclease G